MNAQQIIRDICADVGIAINGDAPWDIRINDDRFYTRVLAEGPLGVGETYMRGWWDAEDLFAFFTRILSSEEIDGHRHVGWRTALATMHARIMNIQTAAQSRKLADAHYNLGNEFFEQMHGPSMAYSCGYWSEAETLDDAQRAKFDLICRKLDLQPGERVLDIGCGWGGFARHAAEKHGVDVVGMTVAREQASYARTLCSEFPVKIICSDYREFDPDAHGGAFDKIVSVGMIEHVGVRNYRTLFEVAKRSLRDQGSFLLHTIGSDVSLEVGDQWISKYIFPGGVLPSMLQLSEAAEGLFVLHDAHNIGVHYTPTLQAWHRNFEVGWASATPAFERPIVWRSEDTFYRMWRYYLQMSAADFAVGDSQVWQLVYANGHLPSGYRCVR